MATIDDLKVNLDAREKDIEFRNINITNYIAVLEELNGDPDINTDQDLKLHKQHIENLLKGEKRELKKDQLVYNALKAQFDSKIANGEVLADPEKSIEEKIIQHLTSLLEENPDLVVPEVHLDIQYVQIVDTDGKKKWVTELGGNVVKVRAE
jgi:hypothetical protein